MPVMSEYQPLVPYASQAFANGYFADRTNCAAWTGATDSQKSAALAHATRHMNTLPYAGFKSGDINCEYEFPRNGDDTIPYEVSCACCEEALAILSGITIEGLQGKAGVASKSIGDVSTSYSGLGPGELLVQNRGFLSSVSLRLMALWMRDDDSFFLDRVN